MRNIMKKHRYAALLLVMVINLFALQSMAEPARPELAQDDVKWLNDKEQEWGQSIDKAVPYIQKNDYTAGTGHLKQADDVISEMKKMLVKKGYDTEKIDRLVAMENLTGAYMDMAKIAALTKDPKYAAAEFDHLVELFNEARDKMKIAEAKFHELPALQAVCSKFINDLDEFEGEIKKAMRNK